MVSWNNFEGNHVTRRTKSSWVFLLQKAISKLQKRCTFTAKNKGIFEGKQISTNQYLLPSPLFFLFSFLICLKIDFLFNPRLWGCSSLLSFGAGQAESARTKPSCFLARLMLRWAGQRGGGRWPVCQDSFLQNHKTAKRTWRHPCLSETRSVCVSVIPSFLVWISQAPVTTFCILVIFGEE